MANFYDDNDDLRFYVEKYIDWEPLVKITEYDYKVGGGFENLDEALDFYKSVLDLVGNFTANEIAPHSAKIDKDHPYLEDGVVKFPPVLQGIFDQMKELELHSMCLPRDVGGMNCPFILFMLSSEMLSRADVSVSAHYGFHSGIALAMLLFSTMEGTTKFNKEKLEIESTRFSEAIGEILSGEAWGSMDITEPGAGSDMAQLRTRGEQDEKGNWFVTGEKIFITSGHAKYHFVIAKTEKQKDNDDAFAGLKGLSMFLVPTYKIDENGKQINIAQFTKLEEKLGHHGSATVAINFDETPAFLVGKRGEGFKYMLTLMNNARVGVGFESLGICEAALRMSKEYAAQRPSMGKTIDKHEMIADYIDEMETDIQGIRALGVASAFHEEMAQKIGLMLKFMPPETDEELRKMESRLKYHQSNSRRLTPLLKYIGSEKAVEVSRRAIQIHGGYGYSEEYGAEKLLRDAMVLPIYEGTSQIQSLMVMKDGLMGILKNPKKFYGKFGKARWAATIPKDTLERRVAKLQLLGYKALQFLMTRIAGKKIKQTSKKPFSEWGGFFKDWDPKNDFSLAMLHAERLTGILTDVAICEILLEQTKKYSQREDVLERYLERAESRCNYLYSQITTTGNRLLNNLAE